MELAGAPAALPTAPGRARVDRGLPAAHGPDPRDDVVGLGVLQQVPDGSGVECGHDPLRVRERGQHQHVRTAVGDDLPGGGDPVDAGHLQVHEHDVGTGTTHDLDGLLTVRRRPDHGDVADPGEQLFEAATDDDAWSSTSTTRMVTTLSPT